MNIEDINTILNHVVNQNAELSKSIKDEKVNKVILKNVLENLRSILDYMAIDIYKQIEDKERKIFFPYGRRENHFKDSVKKNLPNLKHKLPDIYKELELIQPFKSQKSWLVDLCELTNEAKHNNLNKTKHEKSVSVDIDNFISVKNVKNANISGNTINGKDTGSVKINNGEVISQTRGEINMNITSLNKLKFSGKEIEIMPFLESSYNELKKLAESIYCQIL